MATKSNDGIELTSHSEPVKKQPRKKKNNTYTWWELIAIAVQEKNPSSQVLTVLQTPYTESKLKKFTNNFDAEVEHIESGPREVQRSIVDITVKDYTNRGDKNEDETLVKISKSTTSKKGMKYNFITTTGVEWEMGGNLGLNKIIQAGLSGKYGRKNEKTEVKEDSIENELTFEYENEEKLEIPPGKKVRVKLTTYSVRYEQNYTLRFTASSSDSIQVRYHSRDCCGLKSCICGASTCTVFARDLLKNLNGFQETDDEVSFTQDGKLEWVGEGCEVEKIEEWLN